MPDYCFYIKRKKDDTTADNIVQPTDLPEKKPQTPNDLPLPRHRPGEPIMYDPPASGLEIYPITDPNGIEKN